MNINKCQLLITFFLVTFFNFANANSIENTIPAKQLKLTLTQLSDNQGQVYIGAIVKPSELTPYLTKLKGILGDQFKQYRAKQEARDHHLFHMTLLSPKEYQLADKNLIKKILGSSANEQEFKSINVELLGLGTVKEVVKQTYFVVAQSTDAQLLRHSLSLNSKDFHVTLGFNPNDIYGVKKGKNTLIK